MGDGIPEPGSVLSLISNKNIRYEGVLVHIDMDSEAPSLRLKDVRSFGTEGRGDPREARAPSKEVFSDIVFRGSDIIHLEVRNYAQPSAPPQQDPYHLASSLGQMSLYGQIPQDLSLANAIQQQQPIQQPVQQQSVQQQPVWGTLGNDFPVSGTNVWSTTSQQPGLAYPAASQVASVPVQVAQPAPMVVVTPQAPQRPSQPARPHQPSQPSQPAAKSQGWTRDATTPFQNAQQTQQAEVKSNPAAPPGFHSVPPGMQAGPQPPILAAPQQVVVAAPNPNLNGAPGLVPQAVAVAVQPAQLAPPAAPQVEIVRPQTQTLPPYPHQFSGRGRGRGPPRGRGRGGRGRGPNEVPIPREDFNFEEGLQKFDKDQAKAETNTTPELEEAGSGPLYKKDDFFDTLSSDLKDRQTSVTERPTRPSFADQRKMDMETFGGSGVARRGRGRGGRRGRGGVNPHATGREHLEQPQDRGPRAPFRGRGRGRGRGRHSDGPPHGIPVY